jgi:hypothetical protein
MSHLAGGEREKAALVAGVGGVRDELAQENIFVLKMAARGWCETGDGRLEESGRYALAAGRVVGDRRLNFETAAMVCPGWAARALPAHRLEREVRTW